MRKIKLMAATSAVALLTAGSAFAADPVEREGMSLVVYGWVNYLAMYGDTDGANGRSGFFVANNNNSTSRFGFKSTGAINDDLSVGAWMELGYGGGLSNTVTYADPDAGGHGIAFRVSDLWVSSASMGKISLGHGYAAGDGATEVDLSGTTLLQLGTGTALIGNGLFGAGTSYTGMDGLSRIDRIRYDSPSIGGLTVSASTTSEDDADVALRYARAMGDVKVAAAIAYTAYSDSNTAASDELGMSIALKHASGLNIHAGYVERDIDSGADITTWSVKPGYSASLNEYGPTNFAVSYGETEVDGTAGQAELFGVYVSQDISHLGASFYAGYINHETTANVETDIVVIGSRIKF